MRTALYALVMTAALTGCASAPIVNPPLPDAANRAEVLVLRERAFNAGGVGLAFGVEARAHVTLGNGDYTSLFVAPGTHRFFVQARSAEPGVVSLTLKPGEKRCLRTSPDVGNLARTALPIAMMATGYLFGVEERPCPTPEELSKYSRVEVEYAAR